MDSSIYYLNLIKSVNPEPFCKSIFYPCYHLQIRKTLQKAIPELESYLKSDIKNPKSVEDAHVKLANSKFEFWGNETSSQLQSTAYFGKY